MPKGFITLRIYKVLKPLSINGAITLCFITLRIYKVLKQFAYYSPKIICFITLRIYKVLKPKPSKMLLLCVLSH